MGLDFMGFLAIKDSVDLVHGGHGSPGVAVQSQASEALQCRLELFLRRSAPAFFDSAFLGSHKRGHRPNPASPVHFKAADTVQATGYRHSFHALIRGAGYIKKRAQKKRFTSFSWAG